MGNLNGSRKNTTNISCTACKEGKIVVAKVYIDNTPAAQRIFGPGGSEQGEWVEKIYCNNCGVKYTFLPKETEENSVNASKSSKFKSPTPDFWG